MLRFRASVSVIVHETRRNIVKKDVDPRGVLPTRMTYDAIVSQDNRQTLKKLTSDFVNNPLSLRSRYTVVSQYG